MKMKYASLVFVSFFYILHAYKEKTKNISVVPYPVNLENVFIAVKTTQQHEKTRLPIILDTWFLLANQQTWFFTDYDNSTEFRDIQHYTNGHMVVTQCGKTHDRVDLCCKTNHALNRKLNENNQENIKWLCIFDDDNYVNVPNLLKELGKYDNKKDWYLGHQAHKHFLGYEVFYMSYFYYSLRRYAYVPLSGGACLSRSVLIKMEPLIRDLGFVKLCQTIFEPDDVTLGYLLEIEMKVKLTNSVTFRGHDDTLVGFSEEELKSILNTAHNYNKTVQDKTIPGFSLSKDPTRFYSLHCFLGYCSNELKGYYERKLNSSDGHPNFYNSYPESDIE